MEVLTLETVLARMQDLNLITWELFVLPTHQPKASPILWTKFTHGDIQTSMNYLRINVQECIKIGSNNFNIILSNNATTQKWQFKGNDSVLGLLREIRDILLTKKIA